MAGTLGYLITWTTYGTWLQSDERGYVKDGKIYSGNQALKEINKSSQKTEAVLLSKTEKQIVKRAIIKEAALQGQKIYAISVCSNHVHVVAGYIQKPISKIVAYYKKTARLALKKYRQNWQGMDEGIRQKILF